METLGACTEYAVAAVGASEYPVLVLSSRGTPVLQR